MDLNEILKELKNYKPDEGDLQQDKNKSNPSEFQHEQKPPSIQPSISPAVKICRFCSMSIPRSATFCPFCRKRLNTHPLVWVITVLVVLGVIGSCLSRIKLDNTEPATPVSNNANPQPTASPQENALLKWEYDVSEDKMGRGTIRTARVWSVNEVEFGFPYQGPQRAMLMLRSHPKFDKDIILTIERGQFLCGVDGCSVDVRFDNGQVINYKANEPDSHSTTTLFIDDYDNFISNLRQSKKVYIEASFYQEGRKVFEFNSSNLKW